MPLSWATLLYRIKNEVIWLSANGQKRQPCQNSPWLDWRLDSFLQHESLLQRSTVHMASSGIRMCLSQYILIVMTKKMSGITKCTCHRNWLNCSQTVNHKAVLHSSKEKVKGSNSMRAKSPWQQGCFNMSSSETRKGAGHAKNTCHMLNKSYTHKHTHHFVAWGQLRKDSSISLHARMLSTLTSLNTCNP